MRRVRQPTGARQVPEAAECPQGQEGPAERCRRPSRVYLMLLFSEESDAPAGGRVRGFAAARRRPGHASGAARREVGGTREEGRRGEVLINVGKPHFGGRDAGAASRRPGARGNEHVRVVMAHHVRVMLSPLLVPL